MQNNSNFDPFFLFLLLASCHTQLSVIYLYLSYLYPYESKVLQYNVSLFTVTYIVSVFFFSRFLPPKSAPKCFILSLMSSSTLHVLEPLLSLWSAIRDDIVHHRTEDVPNRPRCTRLCLRIMSSSLAPAPLPPPQALHSSILQSNDWYGLKLDNYEHNIQSLLLTAEQYLKHTHFKDTNNNNTKDNDINYDNNNNNNTDENRCDTTTLPQL